MANGDDQSPLMAALRQFFSAATPDPSITQGLTDRASRLQGILDTFKLPKGYEQGLEQAAQRSPSQALAQYDPLGGFLGGSAMDVEYYPKVLTTLGKIEKASQDAARQGAEIHPNLNKIYRLLRGYKDVVEGDVRERSLDPQAGPAGWVTPEQIAEHHRSLPVSMKAGQMSEWPGTGEAWHDPWRSYPPPSETQLAALPEGQLPPQGETTTGLPEAAGRTRELWWDRPPGFTSMYEEGGAKRGGRAKRWLTSEQSGPISKTPSAEELRKFELSPGQQYSMLGTGDPSAVPGGARPMRTEAVTQPNQAVPSMGLITNYTPRYLQDLLDQAEKHLTMKGY